jgi:predicted DNA-binding protein YlxM (UPF0122 family)
MNKVTKKQEEEMKRLYQKGLKLTEIAKKFSVCESTVSYHVNEEYRKNRIKKIVDAFRNKPKEEKSRIYAQRREYLRNYQHRRYNTDKKFRERMKKISNKSYHRRKRNE